MKAALNTVRQLSVCFGDFHVYFPFLNVCLQPSSMIVEFCTKHKQCKLDSENSLKGHLRHCLSPTLIWKAFNCFKTL